MIERFYFYTIIFSQKEMGNEKHTADVVVHNMIERIYFYSIIFSQKEMGSKKHTADVVVPDDVLKKLQWNKNCDFCERNTTGMENTGSCRNRQPRIKSLVKNCPC